jgi:hypothetical protein
MFSPAVEKLYPWAVIRSKGDPVVGLVCEKKLLQAMSSLWMRAAAVNCDWLDSAGKPSAARSWLINAITWLSYELFPLGLQLVDAVVFVGWGACVFVGVDVGAGVFVFVGGGGGGEVFVGDGGGGLVGGGFVAVGGGGGTDVFVGMVGAWEVFGGVFAGAFVFVGRFPA